MKREFELIDIRKNFIDGGEFEDFKSAIRDLKNNIESYKDGFYTIVSLEDTYNDMEYTEILIKDGIIFEVNLQEI
jgi:hypothetical protein